MKRHIILSLVACAVGFGCDDAAPDTKVDVDGLSTGGDAGNATADGEGGSTSGGDAAAATSGGQDGGGTSGQDAAGGTTAGDAGSDVDSGTDQDSGTDEDEDAGGEASWGAHDCEVEAEAPGCADEAVALCVCRGPEAKYDGVSYCCEDEWDEFCVEGAKEFCAPETLTDTCCEAHATDGCADADVQECVCEMQAEQAAAEGLSDDEWHDCCSDGWNQVCAEAAKANCGANCG